MAAPLRHGDAPTLPGAASLAGQDLPSTLPAGPPSPAQGSAAAAVEAHAPEGAPFGRYLLVSQLGRGGMGVVWKAWDPELKRTVALKQILSRRGDDGDTERFLREARAAARLRHPGIVGVHEVGEAEGKPYFTTDYVEGRSLDKVPLPLPARDAAALVCQVAEALAYAHGHGIVHRDVKPANILVDAAGRPYLMDFGLAKDMTRELGASLTLSGEFLGTPAYMSPEQAHGGARTAGPSSDQFSLGAVLYELLTGQRAFRGVALADLLEAVIHQDPLPPTRVNPRVHRDLETVCLRALEKDPLRRYRCMTSFAEDLGRWLAGEPIAARPVGRVARTWRAAVKHRWFVLPALVALALAVYGGATRLGKSQLERRNRETEQAKKAEHQAFTEIAGASAALEHAWQYLYNKDLKYEELARQVNQAKARIEVALQQAPDLSAGHYMLGRCWDLLGMEERAEACWRRAIALDAGFAPAHYELGMLLVTRSILMDFGTDDAERKAQEPAARRLADEATRELEAAAAGNLEQPMQRELARATIAYARKDWDEMARVCSAALQDLGEVEGAEDCHFLLALTKEKSPTGDKEERAELDEAIRLRPRHPLALYFRGLRKDQSGDPKGAIEDYSAALTVKPRFFLALCDRGMAYYAIQDLDRALADYDAALQISPMDEFTHRYRGMVRYERHDVEGALSDLDAALAVDPKDWRALANHAVLMGWKGDLDAAIRDDTVALAQQPDVGTDPDDLKGHLARMRAALARAASHPWVRSGLLAEGKMWAREYAAGRALYEAEIAAAGEGAEADADLRGFLALPHYNLACIHALLSAGKDGPKAAARTITADEAEQERARAFLHLRKGIELGWNDREQIAADEDLAPLHGDPRWAEVMKSAR